MRQVNFLVKRSAFEREDVGVVGRFFRALGVGLACLYGMGAASAAELKISFAELAAIIQTVIGDAKLHLHNKPGGLLDFTATSNLTIAGQQIPITIPPKSFDLLGSTYAYYVDDLNSSSFKVSAVASALRLMVNFESKGADLVGGCVSGECGLANGLPKIIWTNGTVAIDVVPIRSGNRLTLQAKAVTIGGPMRASCDDVSGFFSFGTCEIALNYANRAITQTRPQIAAMLKDTVNGPEAQAKIANSLKKYLVLGPAGEISITDVTSAVTMVSIKFRVVGAAGG